MIMKITVIKKKISNFIFKIMEQYCRNTLKIIMRKFLVSLISILLIKIELHYHIIGGISTCYGPEDVHPFVIFTIIGFSVIMVWKLFGIKNWRTEHEYKKLIHEKKMEYLQKKIEAMGFNVDKEVNVNDLKDRNELRKCDEFKYVVVDKRERYWELNEINNYEQEEQELVNLRTLINYRRDHLPDDLYSGSVVVGAVWLMTELCKPDPPPGEPGESFFGPAIDPREDSLVRYAFGERGERLARARWEEMVGAERRAARADREVNRNSNEPWAADISSDEDNNVNVTHNVNANVTVSVDEPD